MTDVHGCMKRASALIKLLESLTLKFDGDEKAAAGEMDKDLGKEWRKIVKQSNLGFELPDPKHKENKEDNFVKRVKAKMAEEGLNEESFSEPAPLETIISKPKCKKKERPEKDLSNRIQMVIMKVKK